MKGQYKFFKRVVENHHGILIPTKFVKTITLSQSSYINHKRIFHYFKKNIPEIDHLTWQGSPDIGFSVNAKGYKNLGYIKVVKRY
jgi:hypothetical protein